MMLLLILQISWNVWDGLEVDYLTQSQEITRGRILLECPCGWWWYLGDRVIRQSMQKATLIVPGPLPPHVFEDRELHTGGDRPVHYEAYRRRYLAGLLDVVEYMQCAMVAREATEKEAADIPAPEFKGRCLREG